MCELKLIVEHYDLIDAPPTMFKNAKIGFLQLEPEIRRHAMQENVNSVSLAALLEKQKNELILLQCEVETAQNPSFFLNVYIFYIFMVYYIFFLFINYNYRCS